MRIFYASVRSPNALIIPASDLWHRNLYGALVSLGHEVIEFDYDLTETFSHLDLDNPADQEYIVANRPRLEEALLRQLRAVHRERAVDLFFSYFYSACITPSALAEIRRPGIPTVNFYCNAAHQFHLVADIAPHYDVCMVPERQALAGYTAIAARPIYIQMAANPDVYRPYDVPRIYDVTFVGQRYLNRAEWLGYLHRHGINVRAWGPGWPAVPAQTDNDGTSLARRMRRHAGRLKRSIAKWFAGNRHGTQRATTDLPAERCGPPLSDEELILMYSRSHISLNFSEVQDQRTGQIKRHIRLRDFEVPMCGALYFTGYQEELADYYEIGREVVCYDSIEELADKVRYYLLHESEAQKIREAGLRRARRDHTWANRFRQLFAEMGLK